MGRTGEHIIEAANRFFTARNAYFGKLARSEAEGFEYSVRAGRIVYEQFHGYNDFAGKVVLDFGCGRGGKTIYYATRGPRRTLGVDVAGDWTLAREYARSRGLNVEFSVLPRGGRVDLPDGACDAIINSSVLEHIADLPQALGELRRLLKPGGRLLNRWHPFRSRYGSHLHAAIGIPFAHLIFNERDLVRAYCRTLGRRYETLPPTMRPAYQTSATLDGLELHLNRKTVAEMRCALQTAGFHVVQRRFYRGTRPVRLSRYVPERWVDHLIDFEVQVCAIAGDEAADVRAP
jgi:SAM-dependent methyltransferase